MTFFSYQDLQSKPSNLLFYDQPNYSPNVQNQTVDYGGAKWKGNPGQGWSLMGDTGQMQAAQDLKDQTAASNAKFDTMVGQNKSDITDFLTKYQGDTTNTVNATQNKYQIPQQTSVVNALNSRINDLTYNSSNSGAGGYANSSQVGNALSSRYIPLSQSATQNLNTSEGAAQAEENQLLQPDVAAGQQLQARIAEEMTGFTAEQDATLKSYMDALDRGTALTQTQLNNANALAVAKEQATAIVNAATIGNNKVQNVTAGSFVYDPSTGQYHKVG